MSKQNAHGVFHADALFFFAVSAFGLLQPGDATGANTLPGKWAIIPTLPAACQQQPSVGGFATCQEAAAELDRMQ